MRSVNQTAASMVRRARFDDAYMRGACNVFIKSLMDTGVVGNAKVFVVLNEVAKKKGFHIVMKANSGEIMFMPLPLEKPKA